MSGRIKVGGSWRLSEKLSVKVGGTWVDAKLAYVKVAGTWVKWFAALIYDTFTRTTSGSLGSTTSGTLWEAISGTWYANGSAAQSDDAPTAYPIAAVSLDANSTTSASVTPGTGVAFWVTDSGSWWAATSYITSSLGPQYQCGTYQCGSSPYDCTQSPGNYPNCNPNCGTYVSGYTITCNTQYASGLDASTANAVCCASASASTTYSCPSGSYYSGGYCFYYTNDFPCCSPTSTTTYSCYTGYTSTANYACSACPTQTCYSPVYCPSYCQDTVYSYYLRLIKSVGGVVSQATSDVSLGAAAAAISVATQGNQFTAKAYSDQALTTELGSVVFTASSPTTSPKSGIIKAPSPSGQGSTVDNFKLTI